jgi:hypothetical protein
METAADWDSWVGAGVGLLRVGQTTGYLSVDVETVLGSERRAFEANQSAYHLEIGGRRQADWGTMMLFFHHVSRHSLDRTQIPTVSWNDLAFRVSLPFSVGGRPIQAGAGVGLDVTERNTGYRWDVQADMEGAVFKRPSREAYVHAWIRAMKTDSNSTFDRSGFLDLRIEVGGRLSRAQPTGGLFVACEQRNDVLLLTASPRKRFLMGLRFTASEGSERATWLSAWR